MMQLFALFLANLVCFV